MAPAVSISQLAERLQICPIYATGPLKNLRNDQLNECRGTQNACGRCDRLCHDTGPLRALFILRAETLDVGRRRGAATAGFAGSPARKASWSRLEGSVMPVE